MPATKKTFSETLIKTSEFSTPERARQHGGMEIEPLDRSLRGDVIQVRQKAVIADKLDWYLQRGVITEGMAQAGKKLMNLFYRARENPHYVASSYERSSGRYSQEDVMTANMAAKRKLRRVITQLKPQEINVLWDVCAVDKFAGKDRVAYLVTGLNTLAESWGY